MKPLLLAILDGFGMEEPGEGNAISLANTPFLDELFKTRPNITLGASGLAVGLPEGQMGNSEVGHLNIGAGRVVFQELTRINMACKSGELEQNEVLREAMDAAAALPKGAVHFMGLLSDGGVHSNIEHLFALMQMAAKRGVPEICVHGFLDGRDVSPTSGVGYVEKTVQFCDALAARYRSTAHISSLMGRYWAMDRDKRWERVSRAHCAIAAAGAYAAADPATAVRESYENGITDEFMEPTVFKARGVREGDTVIFFNFRPDRARELTHAFVDEEFTEFDRMRHPKINFVCLTEYDPGIPAPIAFPKTFPENTLADLLAARGLRQLHIAETEKYAHVTFFLNGGIEAPKEGEERVLVPSPKVATYDLQPEMSAPEVTAQLVQAIEEERADVYIVNYANCDMVGHTGVLPAATAAVEAVDAGLQQVVAAILAKGGQALITADHGNADCMVAPDGSPFTAHTTARVPLILVTDDSSLALADAEEACLADIAPTLIALAGIPQPSEWTGISRLQQA